MEKVHIFIQKKIQYEGEYFNGKKKGHLKYVWKDGEYYIGEWRSNLMHGKGKNLLSK